MAMISRGCVRQLTSLLPLRAGCAVLCEAHQGTFPVVNVCPHFHGLACESLTPYTGYAARDQLRAARIGWPAPSYRVFEGQLARYFCTESTDSKLQEAQQVLTYEGPWSKTITRLKILSLCSCACTFLVGPAILVLDTSATAIVAKAGIAVMMASFGIFTTGLLHWFTSPYVHSLTYDPDKQALTVKSISILAQPQIHHFSIDDVRYPDDTIRPQVSFMAKGRFFYIDPVTFPHAELLQKLNPVDPVYAKYHQAEAQPGRDCE